MRIIAIAVLCMLSAQAQAYAPPGEVLRYDPHFEYFEPEKGPFTMHAIPFCMPARDFTELVHRVRWTISGRAGAGFAVYRHANGNVLWVEREDCTYCITATGDPDIGMSP